MRKDVAAAMRDAALMEPMVPYIAAVLDEQMQAVDNRAQSMHNAGDLTPERALALWMEKLAYKKALGAFAGKAKQVRALASRGSLTSET